MLLSKILPFFLDMKRFSFLFFLQFLSIACFAQFQDDFSGDLSNWQGDIASFIIEDEQLELNATVAGESKLLTQVNLPDSLFWEFYFKMNFNPSNNNNLRVYLQADDEDLPYSEGYFLQIGENLSDDAVQLWRNDGGIETQLATATLGAVSNSPEVKLRIERDADGTWRLLADYLGGDNFSLEFEIQDDTYPSAADQFFGFRPKYTVGNINNFMFDDVVIAELLPDIEPPVLISATPNSPTEIDVVFNENLDPALAENIANYTINNGVGMPMSADLDGSNGTLVHLTLSSDLENADDYVLTTNNIADLEENISGMQTASFSFFQPDEAEPFDVLINEIMADPSPAIGLPIAEYIELYNRSDKVIDLADFGFSNGSSPKLLPSYILQPDQYVIVTDEDNLDSLSVFGEVITLGAFPALTNGGDELTLTSPFGEIIHFVNYNLDWYGDSNKEGGGYSLELISPFNICEGQNNWRATNNAEGGTPGIQNSIFNPTPDEKRPELLRGYVNRNNPNQIKLFFTEILEQVAAEDPDTYSINPDVDIANISLSFPNQTTVLINLNSPLEVGIDYEITVRDELNDCSGNAIGLFNQATTDYLELHNKTDKTFDLSELVIRNGILFEDQLGNDSLGGTAVAINTEFLFLPKTYLTLTPDPSFVQENYTVANPEWLFRTALPAFANDGGNIKITIGENLETIYIDSVNYLSDWHHPLLDNEEGVSLERINIEAFSDDAGNWHSAAGTAGFGTPTAPNSQSIDSPTPIDDTFTLINPTFSPDGDGFRDFVQINYLADQNGYIANAKIFDATGREIIQLLNNELLGLEGTFKWDGSTNEGEKARIGIYILWIELFLPTGEKRIEKKTIVVGGEF